MTNDNRTSLQYLDRILLAHQEGAPRIRGVSLAIALDELRAGSKKQHWIWYVFPQISFEGQRDDSKFYALQRCEDVQVLLAHPLALANFTQAFNLAERALTQLPTLHIRDVFGIDEKKVVSSATLFAGFLHLHPQESAQVLNAAANVLLEVASRDNLVCEPTINFLATC